MYVKPPLSKHISYDMIILCFRPTVHACVSPVWIKIFVLLYHLRVAKDNEAEKKPLSQMFS